MKPITIEIPDVGADEETVAVLGRNMVAYHAVGRAGAMLVRNRLDQVLEDRKPIPRSLIWNIIREETDPTQVSVAQIDVASIRIWRAVNGIEAGEEKRPEVRESSGPVRRITIPNASPEAERIEVHLPETDWHGHRRPGTYYTYFDMGQAPALFEALGAALGVRPISPELAEGLWMMFAAARRGADEEEAFRDVLVNGLKYSARGIPEGSKTPRAPEPSASLKEAIGKALRSYRTVRASDELGPGCPLVEFFGTQTDSAEEELDRLADHLAGAVAHVAAAEPEKKEPSAWDVRHAIADWLNYADDRHAPDCTIHRPGMNWTNCDCRKARDEIFRVLPWYVVDADDATDDDLQESIRRVIEADHHGRRIEDYDRDQLACKIVAIVEAARPKASQPALSPADVRALRWAVQRAAEAALPIGEGELRQRAMAAAERLTARPALTAEEARAIRNCASYCATTAQSPWMRRFASLARAAVDRLTGSPGSPTSADPPEPTEGKGDSRDASEERPAGCDGTGYGEGCGCGDDRHFCPWHTTERQDDGTAKARLETLEQWRTREADPRLTIDRLTLGSLRERLDLIEGMRLHSRLAALEASAGKALLALETDAKEIRVHQGAILALQAWRRSCAHLPEDAEALAALVDAAVERAVEPVKNTTVNAHRLAVKAIDAAGAASREAGDAMAHAKRVWQGHVGDWNKLHERILALEMHRRGVNDGTAELAAKAEDGGV